MSFDGLLLSSSSSSSLFDDDDDDDDDAAAREREKKDASHLLRVLMICEMDDACCDARERKRGGEWINLSAIGFLGPNSLSPPSSFHHLHLHRRGFFFPVSMTLSLCLFSQNARRIVCSVHNACVCILIY